MSFLVGWAGREWQRKLKRGVPAIFSAKAKMRWRCLALVLEGWHIAKQMAIGAHHKRCPVFTEGKRMPWQRPLGKEEKGKAYSVPDGPLSQMTESSIRAKIALLRLTIGFLTPCFGSTNSPHNRCCKGCFFSVSPPIRIPLRRRQASSPRRSRELADDGRVGRWQAWGGRPRR